MSVIQEYFKLTRAPFGKISRYDELFHYSQLDQLIEFIKAALADGNWLLATGRAGTGKTTGVACCLDLLPSSKYKVIYVGQEQRRSGVLSRLLFELGARANTGWSGRTLKLSQKLQDTIRTGRKVVIVIDEAHVFEQQALEDVRLLCNLDMDRSIDICLVMLGQHWLRSILKKVANEAMYQRLKLRFALEGLTEAETKAYISHHLKLAGCQNELFTEDAVAEIFAASEGILREVNNICYASLLHGALNKLHTVDKKLVEHVLNTRELS